MEKGATMNFKILTSIAIVALGTAIATEIVAAKSIYPNISSESYETQNVLLEQIGQFEERTIEISCKLKNCEERPC